VPNLVLCSKAQFQLDSRDTVKLSIVDLRAQHSTMAQPNLAEDTNTDFSGLASSLLPPSGAFFSGWTPQQWQNVTQRHNAHDMQGVQQRFANSYHGASFQNGLSDSSAAYQPNEFKASDRALSSGEASAPASAAPSDSAQIQFYQVCFASFCGTSLTQSAGYERQRLWN
jgi:hypothetical protein